MFAVWQFRQGFFDMIQLVIEKCTWLRDFCFLSHVGRYRDIPFPSLPSFSFSFSFSFPSPSAFAVSSVSSLAFSDWSGWAADSSAFSFTSVSEPASVVMVTRQPAERQRRVTRGCQIGFHASKFFLRSISLIWNMVFIKGFVWLDHHPKRDAKSYCVASLSSGCSYHGELEKNHTATLNLPSM